MRPLSDYFCFFKCFCWEKTEEEQFLLSPSDPSLQDKGKGPEVVIQMPQTNEEVPQNPDITYKNAQIIKYCGKALLGTGLTYTGLLLGAVGVSTGLEEHNPQHPNIEHAASLITYVSCAVAATAFISGAFVINYANKLLEKPQPPAEKVDKSQQATSSSNAEQYKTQESQQAPYEAPRDGKGCGLY